MKKILFAALTVLLLTAVCVVGLLPALSDNGAEGVLNADMLNAYGATVDADKIEAAIAAEEKESFTVPSDAIAIATAEQWAAMESGKVYQLTADITVTKSLGSAEEPFSVVIYGNRHTVTTSVPLFAYADKLGVAELYLTGTVTGGGALADVANVVEAMYVSTNVSVTGVETAGGLVGEAAEFGAYYCINTGNVQGGETAGGLVGSVTLVANIDTCVNGDGTTGAVTATNNAGGLVGKAESTDAESCIEIEECVNYAAVATTDTKNQSAAGGLAGSLCVAEMELYDCSNFGTVTGYGIAVSTVNNGFGGIVGRASGDEADIHIENCFNSGLISAAYVADNAHYNGAAGILGYDLCGYTEISGCYNMGAVRAVGGTVNAGMGGMIGQTENGANCETKELYISECINLGAINGGRPGGILGVGEYFTGVALIESCINGGDIKSPANYAAGIAARLEPLMAATADVSYPISFVDCTNSGTVTAGSNCAGGIYGYATGKTSTIYFESCSNTGRINNKHAGGILANVAGDAEFMSCSNSGKVYATAGGYSGGIAGNVGGKGTFTECINKGDIVANFNASDMGALTGGICGHLIGGGTFTDCANEGKIVGGSNHTGGIAAEINDVVSFVSCTNSGNVTSNANDAAGICAKTYVGTYGTTPTATYTDCVNTGTIVGARHAAGIAAYMECQTTYTSCINEGAVTAAQHAGGIAAVSQGDDATFVKCVNDAPVKGNNKVGGILGVSNSKVVATSCINLAYVEGGEMVGGIVGAMGSTGDGHAIVGCVSMGDVYNNCTNAYNAANFTDNRGNGTGGIVGYAWAGTLEVSHCLVTGHISANYNRDMGEEIQNHQPVGGIVGYHNNNNGRIVYNTFTGTLDGGEYGEEIFLKALNNATVCNNTADAELICWNYSVNAYPFFIERHGSSDPLYYYLVEYGDDGKATATAAGHHDLAYEGWHLTATTVSDGSLLTTLNTAAGEGKFTQVSFCGGESYPVYTETATLLETWYEGEHDYDQLKTDETYHWYECACGAEGEKTEHDYNILASDEKDHWYACECGAEIERMSHGSYFCADGTHHWTECYYDCGYVSVKVEHNPVQTWDDTYHGSYCEVCYELLSYEEHSFTVLVSSQTADYYHTYVCSSCGAPSGVDELHSFEEFDVTDDGHRMRCACGAVSTDDYTKHTVFDTTKVYTDGEYHWQLCACGYVMDKEEHYCETDATCDTKQVCAHCGTEFGALAADSHEREIQWTTTPTQHYGWYPCCGMIIDYTDHTFEDGVCTVCKMVCVHEGGTATCLKPAVCQYCDEEYGEVDKTNHDANCSVTWYRNATDHAEYRSHHKGILTCETIVEAEAHDFVNGICSVCSFNCVTEGCEGDGTETCQQLAKCKYCGLECGALGNHVFDLNNWSVDDEADKHYHACTTVGCTERADETACSGNETAATCRVKSTCTACGQSYGEFGDHDFDEESFLRMEDTDQHYNPCTREGCTEKGNVTACFGGTANCVDEALCEKCGVAYGSVAPDNHKDSGATKFVATEGSERTRHDERYTCCNALKETTNHQYDAATGECGICHYVCAHGDTEEDFTYNRISETEHSKTCKICGVTVNEAHTETTAATCQAPAFCNLCGMPYGEKDPDAHNFSTEWTQNDNYVISVPDISMIDGEPVIGAVHYYACLNGSCGEMKDFGICDGEATCKEPAKCSVCDGEYGAVASKHTGLETTWSHEVIEGVTYHYHYCTDCEGKDQDRAACAGTAATCAGKAKCSVCNTEFGESDATNHALTTQSWKVDAEHNQHYKVWDCCNVEVEDTRATHVYPKDGVPYVCECGHACDHTVGGFDYEDKEDGTHDKSCKDCGYTENLTHTYADTWEHAVDAMGDVTHFHACACGAKNEEGTCTFDVAATCKTAAKCSVCGRTDENGPVADAHVWGTYTKVDDLTHNRTCTVEGCGEDDIATDHVFGEDIVCDGCGYTCTHETTKGWSDWESANDAQHQRICQNCGYTDKADHTETTAADCVNKAYCEVCDSRYGEVGTEHDFDLENWVNTDADNHWHKCKVEGCDVVNGTAAHVYDRYAHDENDHWLVCICGCVQPDVLPVAHEMAYEFDENGHWQTCECGKTTASEPLDHSFEVVSNASGHWEQCVCGATTGGDPVKHIFSAETGICTAADCGYACTHSGELTYVADAELSTVHDVYCNECGKKIAENGVHTFDLLNPHYVCEGAYHWIACPCGAKFDAENGAVEHSTGAEGDLEATCTAKAYCSVCGEYYGEVDPYNHATPDAFDYWTDPDDLSRHFKAYDCCGMRITNEAHTFENGECKFCDADCTHTGGTANCKDKAICKICGIAYGELATTHVYSNACDTDCNACGVTRETAHTYGDWVEVLAPTTNAKGKETRTCSVCGAIDTYESDMLPAKEKDNTTVIVVAVVAGSVVGVGAIVGICVWISKSRAAAKIAAEQKPWRTKQQKKKKWKKKK